MQKDLMEYAMEQQFQKLTGEMLYEEHVNIFPVPYTRVAFASIHADAQARWEKLAENIRLKMIEK